MWMIDGSVWRIDTGVSGLMMRMIMSHIVHIVRIVVDIVIAHVIAHVIAIIGMSIAVYNVHIVGITIVWDGRIISLSIGGMLITRVLMILLWMLII